MLKKLPLRYWIIVVFMSLFGHLSAQDIAINEFVSSNQSTIADEDNSFEDWIELYNYGTTTVSLQGFGLSDDANSPFKWVFPNVSLAPKQFMLVWASDKNRTTPGASLHTNFKISASGETIVLTRADSMQVDLVVGIALQVNASYGRQPDGTGAWQVFNTPTPNAANAGAVQSVNPPVFSHESGLYTDSFHLSLSHTNPNVTIVYTLDGSEPDINNLSGTSYRYKNEYSLEPGDPFGPFLNSSYSSHSYIAPIKIYNRSSEPDKYTHMNTRQHIMYYPVQPVRKGMIVKAKAYVDNIGSKTVTRNFFVWPQGNPYDIPVISLQIQEDFLFDYDKGTYTAGVDFDTWRTNNPTNNQWYRPEWGNYWRSGKDWEYPVHIEIFEPSAFTSVMSKNGGMRIHGNNSRALPVKSLRLYAREDGNFELNLFKEKLVDAANPNNNQFKRIMLRGEGTGGPVYYDVVFNRLMLPVFSGISRIKPAIHFINGEYWGITALRDRFDEHHYALNYNLDPDNIIVVDCAGSNCEIDVGDATDYAQYLSMRDFIRNNNMADEAKFAKADSMLCMESFIDHMVLEIYASNDSYERSYWKVRTPENQLYGDGKWRMNVKDFEASLKSNINWLANRADPANSANQALLGNLLANNTFKNNFINRFADLINTAYSPDRFKAIIDTTLNEVSPYLAEDANRFPRPTFYRASERQNLINWANSRPAIQRDSIRSYFNLNGTFDLNLNVSDADGGYIKVNTVDITSQTPGVPQNPYPWTGVYFDQIPVTLKAIAKPGYLFSHWSGDVTGTNDSITLQTNNTFQVQANFVIDTSTKVVYFWLMDNRISNDTPLQSLNATYASNNLSATLQYTSCLVGYPFDNQHPNWRKASMERRNAPTPVNYHPVVNNDISYENVNMRAIQIKQPFRKDGLENTLTLNIPTVNLAKIKVSVAAESDGAAEKLLVDYWNGATWDTSYLPQSVFTLTNSYSLVEVDFSQVTVANNNPDFKVRIRFDGTNMEADSGLRVHFNNIAVDGMKRLPSGIKHLSADTRSNMLNVYPNPAQHNLMLESDEAMESITIMNVYGQVLQTINYAGKTHEVALQALPASLYLVRVQWKDQEKTIRVIKQ